MNDVTNTTPASPGAAQASGTDGAAAAGTAVQPVPAAAPVEAAPAAPQSNLDSPSLLGAAKGEKPAAPKPDAPAADTKPADTKSSPVDAKPAEGAVTDAKAQDGKAEDGKSQDAKPEGDKPKAEGDKPQDAKAKEPAKDEKPKAEGEAPKDAKAEPPPPVKYEAFTVPEGMKLDDAKVKELTEIIGPLQVPQEQAQKIVDLGTSWLNDAAKQMGDHMRKEQRDDWNTLNNQWKDELRSDRELGGNRAETTLARAKAVIEEYLSPEQQKRYLAHIDMNGMSNFIEHIRLLNNIGEALNVFEDKIVAPPAVNPNAGRERGFRRNYKNSGNGRGA